MSVIDFMLSERQQRVLSALILHPGRQYGTNELLAIAGSGVGAGRNVIAGLEKSGIVLRAIRGNQVVYSINTGNPIYSELRAICLKTFGMKEVVADALRQFGDRIQLAFMFGSIVKGTDRPDSDVDLMVVGDVDVFELAEATEKLQAILGREIDLNLHSPEEWKQLASDRVIGAIMKEDKIMVVGE
ncbi:nucleotidyltransferase domain-containing protein [Agrobacterium rubi]|nr:nucleotidyltransferase domain-containing protein [Agrobacterium rubi]NTF23792.1 nucleotidyltransferase domain-containing protein [Agrobacterium rubi]